MKTCCITGHPEFEKEKEGLICEALKVEIKRAIEEGYTHFMTGLADGVDIMFAEIIVALQKEFKITLEALLPYPNFYNKSARRRKLISKCVAVGFTNSEYVYGCHLQRNLSMVNLSDRVIAVYDNRPKGRTEHTIHYAKIRKKDLRLIKI